VPLAGWTPAHGHIPLVTGASVDIRELVGARRPWCDVTSVGLLSRATPAARDPRYWCRIAADFNSGPCGSAHGEPRSQRH
jgi:hypothetical protein